MTVNSSDWIAKAAQSDGARSPSWIDALASPGEFNAASPFAHLGVTQTEPATAAIPAAELPSQSEPQSEWDRGFAAGEAAGRAAAEAQIGAASQEKLALRTAFRTLDQAAMDALANELADTVVALCDAALGEQATDKDALVKRVRQAAQRLGTAAQNCTLHLHPDDAAMLDETALSQWEISTDAALERGSLAFAGPDGGVRDGPAEWRRAIANALRG